MNWQALLLEPAIMAALVGGRPATLANRVGSAAGILTILAACSGLVAALSFLAGGYIWLEHRYDAETALLIMGCAATSLSCLFILAGLAIIKYKRMRISVYQHEITRRAESIVSAVMSEFEQPIQAYPKTAVSIAAMAGYMAGEKMQDGTETLFRAFERLRA